MLSFVCVCVCPLLRGLCLRFCDAHLRPRFERKCYKKPAPQTRKRKAPEHLKETPVDRSDRCGSAAHLETCLAVSRRSPSEIDSSSSPWRVLMGRLSASARRWSAVRRLRGGADSEVDEGLYSRQLYVLGHKAQRSLSASAILLIGLSGLGAEVSKNLVLAGVGSLDVHDPTPATLTDLSSSFLLQNDDLGFARGKKAAERLAPLNPYVRVRSLDALGPQSDETAESSQTQATNHWPPSSEPDPRLDGYTVVVAVDRPHAELLSLSAACRRSGCRLVACDSRGVFGRVFCDFGEEFTVDDVDGETPKSALLEHVGEDEFADVSCVPEQPHGLEDGDTVRFEEVDGMEPLCAEGKTFQVTVRSRHVVTIGDTRGLGTYSGGGRMVQVKQPRVLKFQSFEEALKSPGILDNGMDSPKRLRTIHACFACADAVIPHPATQPVLSEPILNQDEAAAALHGAIEMSNLVPEGRIVSSIVDDFAGGAGGALSPMAAFLGGVAAQEVIKACTHRYTPLEQFLYVDASSCLPTPRPTAAERAPQGDRYDGQRAVLGGSLVDKLKRLTYFVVGSGAIGCELLKCLALMGVACGEGNGRLHVTDMDTIERSNLNRQFLFRPADVGKAKSRCAADAVKAINPELQIHAYEERVGEDSGSFNEAFWTQVRGRLEPTFASMQHSPTALIVCLESPWHARHAFDCRRPRSIFSL